MYPEHIPYLEESAAMAQRISNDVEKNRSDIDGCVGERVAQAYKEVLDGIEKQMKRVRGDLWLLQQNITLE